MYYDIIIIGSGISGLYAAYNIQKMSPSTSFIILEKYKRKWIGGRSNNEMFYGTQVVTGAGIGRKNKDKLLIQLLNELDLPYKEFDHNPHYSEQIDTVIDVKKSIQYLKREYKKDQARITFKEFAKPILGDKLYHDFLVSSGYTDYENADAFDVIHNYGMDDNACCWKGLHINWKQLVETLCNKIGIDKIKTSMNVVSITPLHISTDFVGGNECKGNVAMRNTNAKRSNKMRENPCIFSVETDKEIVFRANKVIVATTIDSIKKIIPTASRIYNEIKSQEFLRLYGKFTKKSSEIMKKGMNGYTIVSGPLQKIIPMDVDKGVYMIAYSDNKSAIFLKKYLENTPKNREVFCHLIEKALGLPNKSLELIAIKDYYWTTGTHYYTPLPNEYENREAFIHAAQNPERGILVVGEVVSKNQGWINGALSSVSAVLNKRWVETVC